MSKAGSGQKQPSNESANKLKVLEWVDRLSMHFNAPQEEDQINIFVHALRNCTPFQLDEAFDRCLNECQFMPKLADIHGRMPEQKYAPENPGRFIQKKPILDLIRPIAEEISVEIAGREYWDLDPISDAKLIEKVFHEANTVRYIRMGCEGKWLKPSGKQIEIAARNKFTDWANI